jgi:hypothetical protein
MDTLWIELLNFCELSVRERQNLLLAIRHTLFEQHARHERHQQEVEAQQVRLQQRQQICKNQLGRHEQQEMCAQQLLDPFGPSPFPSLIMKN